MTNVTASLNSYFVKLSTFWNCDCTFCASGCIVFQRQGGMGPSITLLWYYPGSGFIQVYFLRFLALSSPISYDPRLDTNNVWTWCICKQVNALTQRTLIPIFSELIFKHLRLFLLLHFSFFIHTSLYLVNWSSQNEPVWSYHDILNYYYYLDQSVSRQHSFIQ